MRSTKLAMLAVVPVLAVGVVACGDDENEKAATTATPAETTPAAAPAGKDIVALASDTPDLATLVKAVTAAELVETLQGEGPFTVFAPANDAFTELGQDTLDTLLAPAGKGQLTDILLYHVVPGEVKAADLKDGQKLKTVQGGKLTVNVADTGAVTVGGARVTMADVDASNGVVHVINKVLMPPAA